MIAQSPNMMINTLGIYQHYRTDWCHRFRIFWNAVATCMVQYKIRLLRSTYMWVIFVHQRHIHAHARKWSNQICSNTIEYQYNSILYMFTTYIYIYMYMYYTVNVYVGGAKFINLVGCPEWTKHASFLYPIR